jgi:hypothetical protein
MAWISASSRYSLFTPSTVGGGHAFRTLAAACPRHDWRWEPLLCAELGWGCSPSSESFPPQAGARAMMPLAVVEWLSRLRPWYGCGRAVEAPVPCLLREERSVLPSSSESVWNSSAEFPVMARSGDGGLLRVEPMTVASEPSPRGERLRPLKRSVMNSRLPK